MDCNEDSNNITEPKLVIDERLESIKFLISEAVCKKYLNPFVLQNEIMRCFPNQDLKVKFAFIKNKMVTIVTDDQHTHSILSGNWPENSFEKGLKKIDKNEDRTFKANLLAVHNDISLNDKEIKKQLEKQGIINATRLLKRGINEPTMIVTADIVGKFI